MRVFLMGMTVIKKMEGGLRLTMHWKQFKDSEAKLIPELPEAGKNSKLQQNVQV